MTAAHNLRIESAAARALLANYNAILGEDEIAKADAVEGETDLHEAIGVALERVLELQTLMGGIDATIELLKTRRERLKAQEAGIRKSLLEAMAAGAIKRIENPVATITRKAVAPSVVIIDDKIIPPSFMKTPAPVLDRAGLLKALRDGERIDGAALSNGGETVQIRWS